MNEEHSSSVIIKHYKKQLIYRQNDVPNPEDAISFNNNMFELAMEKFTNKEKICEISKGERKVRKKRKNRNCRGQFRHEAMELIKLGTNNSSTLFKSKDALIQNLTVEKPANNKKTDSSQASVRNKLNQEALDNDSINLRHSLPQMVPERRNSKELVKMQSPPHSIGKPVSTTNQKYPQILQKPTKDETLPKFNLNNNDNNNNSYQIHPQLLSSYIPQHYPVPPRSSTKTTLHNLLVQPFPYPPQNKPLYRDNKLKISPSYMNYPPQQKLKPLTKPTPSPPYPLIHPPHPLVIPSSLSNNSFITQPSPYPSYPKKPFYDLKSPQNIPPPQPRHLPQPLPQDYLKKRAEKKKQPPECNHPVPIDLTVEQNNNSTKNHKCKCECGKVYPQSVQEVIIKVPEEFQNSSQVPIIKGKMINGVLKYENSEPRNGAVNKNHFNVNATSVISSHKAGLESKREPPVIKDNSGKPSQMFLIKNIITKDDSKTTNDKNKDPVITSRLVSPPQKLPPLSPLEVISRSPGVIVANHASKLLNKKAPVTDFGAGTIVSNPSSRRESVELDTISISSGSSDSVISPTPRSAIIERQIPQGKLFYLKNNHCFVRYFDDKQKQLFIDNMNVDEGDVFMKNADSNEIIALPQAHAPFNEKDNLTVEDYVSEITLVEKFVPRDFFLFYKFVTGYQIYNRHLPVSFLTFLKLYNTNGLKDLLERYINSLSKRT